MQDAETLQLPAGIAETLRKFARCMAPLGVELRRRGLHRARQMIRRYGRSATPAETREIERLFDLARKARGNRRLDPRLLTDLEALAADGSEYAASLLSELFLAASAAYHRALGEAEAFAALLLVARADRHTDRAPPPRTPLDLIPDARPNAPAA